MLATPCTIVDLARLESNIERMADAIRSSGVTLRPHAKTHKTIEIARRQLDAGASGLTVATLREAAAFADGGATDVFVAYPVWAGEAHAGLLRSLHGRIRLRVGIDGVDAAAALASAVRGARRPLPVVIEIDSGLHRTGVTPEHSVVVADACRRAGLDVLGVFTHAGHAYFAADGVDAAADDEVRSLGDAASLLRERGHDVRIVSAGSTPTAHRSARPPVNEERPGTYVFGDAAQVTLGACGARDIALHVRATVVSTAVAGQVVIDAGSKALSSDRRPWQVGHGVLADHPGCVVERLSEEHGVVTASEGASLPRLGQIVDVIPNHVCSVVNLSSELVVIRDDRVVERWPVVARR